MTDSDRFMRDAGAANQRQADQIEEATGEDEEDFLSRHDHVYGAFVQPNVLHSEGEPDEEEARGSRNDQAQRDNES